MTDEQRDSLDKWLACALGYGEAPRYWADVLEATLTASTPTPTTASCLHELETLSDQLENGTGEGQTNSSPDPLENLRVVPRLLEIIAKLKSFPVAELETIVNDLRNEIDNDFCFNSVSELVSRLQETIAKLKSL